MYCTLYKKIKSSKAWLMNGACHTSYRFNFKGMTGDGPTSEAQLSSLNIVIFSDAENKQSI